MAVESESHDEVQQAADGLRHLPPLLYKDVVRSCRRRGQLERAMAILAARQTVGLPVDRVLHNDVIAMCADKRCVLWSLLRCSLSLHFQVKFGEGW